MPTPSPPRTPYWQTKQSPRKTRKKPLSPETLADLMALEKRRELPRGWQVAKRMIADAQADATQLSRVPRGAGRIIGSA